MIAEPAKSVNTADTNNQRLNPKAVANAMDKVLASAVQVILRHGQDHSGACVGSGDGAGISTGAVHF